jgi:hypothetical protein
MRFGAEPHNVPMRIPPKHLRSQPFELLGKNSVNNSWNGSPVTLNVNESVSMPQTPNGTMVFGYFNQATQNNSGDLIVTSGGGAPTTLVAPANTLQPSIWMNNWQANNLNVTNVSPNSNTPIWISAFGPGVPGQYPLTLQSNGTPVALVPAQSAQGTALPQYMQLVMTCNAATLAIFAIIGGPGPNNEYVISVNAAYNSGPGTQTNPPAGYYATTVGNSYAFPFNWGSSLVYVVNMSPATTSGANVLMRSL